jgi:hypothetical protein
VQVGGVQDGGVQVGTAHEVYGELMRYLLDHHRAKTERLPCRRDLKNMKLGGKLKIVEGSKSSW